MNRQNSDLRPLDQTTLSRYWESVKAKHGDAPPVDEEESTITCPSCGGLGYYTLAVPVNHPDFGKFKVCDYPGCAAAEAILLRRLKNYELPKEYGKLTFATWEALPPEVRQHKEIAYFAARAFCEVPEHMVNLAQCAELAGYAYDGKLDYARNCLVLYSTVGMGKTGLVAACINRLAELGGSGSLYRRTSDIFDDLQDSFNDRTQALEGNEQTFSQRFQRYKRADILFLDEWRMAKLSDFRLQTMEDLIRYRHGHDLPTVITTNLTPDNVYSHWGEQTADVVMEMAHWIQLSGIKLRQTMRGVVE
jgi:DNA replication protein DnaC